MSESNPIWWGLATSVVLLAASGCAVDADDRRLPTMDEGGPQYGVESGPCNDGSERDCSVDLGTNDDGIHGCFVGVQVCVEGTWSTCDHADDEGGTRELSVSAGPVDCAANPCDPDCKEYDEAPSSPVVATSSGSGGLMSGDVTDLPGGFQNKGLPGSCSTSPDNCQFDYDCDAGTNTCQPWADGDYEATGGLPDYTLKVPCSGVLYACNRGNGVAPAGATVAVFPGNSGKMTNCSAGSQTGGLRGSCVVPTAMNPGECVEVPGCAPFLTGGTKNIVINHAQLGAPLPESNCRNNWSTHANGVSCISGTTTYTTETYYETYEATCPAGDTVLGPRWTYFSYDSSTPSDSNIEFNVRASVSIAGLSGEPFVPLASAQASPDTQVVSPASPIDLGATLGPGSQGAFLEVEMIVNPSSDTFDTPSLNDWNLMYSCVPTE